MFDHQITFLYVSDLDRAAAFYGDVLGFRLVLDQGGCRIFEVAHEAYIGVCTFRNDQVGVDGALVTFVASDVDRVYERLAAAGAVLESPPRQNADYGIYHFYARDPDGNRFEIQRFDDETWNVAEP